MTLSGFYAYKQLIGINKIRTSSADKNINMKKIFYKLISSGIWIQPFFMTAIIKYLQLNAPSVLNNTSNRFICLLLSFLPVLIIFTGNINKPREEDAFAGKAKAMYPPIPSNLLYKRPEGIILGKDKRSGRYVCKRLEEDGHIFLIGGSGTGKTSAYVIPALLINKTARIFAVDIKGELSSKTAKLSDKHTLIFNPLDRSMYGYDPFYELTDKNSTQRILEAMQTIAFSLIPMPSNLKDPFWKNSARNLLLGLMIFYYRQEARSFVEITDEILTKPIRDSIDAVMEIADPSSIEYRYIVQFKDMTEETLGGIVSEMNNHIVIFSNDQDIRYAFKDNPRKVNPLKLEEGYSIYLSIKEEKLSAYYDVMQLIINQTLSQLEKRPEDSKPIIFVIDELPRILSAGKIGRLLDGARTLRSRKVCLFLITQSTESLMSAFTENEVLDLISNCLYIIVLSASSWKTQKTVCAWCGKYKVRKISWGDSDKNKKRTIFYEEHDIVEPSELMTLSNSNEAIIITPFGYGRVRKTPYYEDVILKPLAEEIISFNRCISDI